MWLCPINSSLQHLCSGTSLKIAKTGHFSKRVANVAELIHWLLCVCSGEQESKGVQVCLQPPFMVQPANFLCNYNKSQRQTRRMVLSLCNYSINRPIFSPRKPSQFLPFSLPEKVVILNTIGETRLKNLFCKQRVKRRSPLLSPTRGSRVAVCSKGGICKARETILQLRKSSVNSRTEAKASR